MLLSSDGRPWCDIGRIDHIYGAFERLFLEGTFADKKNNRFVWIPPYRSTGARGCQGRTSERSDDIKVGPEVAGDLISNSSLLGFTRRALRGRWRSPLIGLPSFQCATSSSKQRPVPSKQTNYQWSIVTAHILPRLAQHFHCRLTANNL